MVQGIDNIGICTTDVERSVAFYQRLGFSEAYRNDRGVLVAAGGRGRAIRRPWGASLACLAIRWALTISASLWRMLMRCTQPCTLLVWRSAVLPRTNPGAPEWSVS